MIYILRLYEQNVNNDKCYKKLQKVTGQMTKVAV